MGVLRAKETRTMRRRHVMPFLRGRTMSAALLLGLAGAVAAGCGSRDDSSAAIADRAKARDVVVVAYDASINNAELDYFASFHNERVGELQGPPC